MTRRFTGWHAATILVGFFLVVVAVNVTMATYAVRGFSGVVVQNSYVASQQFNRWLAEQRREDALGWSADVSRDEAGRLAVVTYGMPEGARIVAHLRRPIGLPGDRSMTLAEVSPARFASPAIEQGRWIVRLEVSAGGHSWSHEARIG